ncbi:nitroreductase [Rhodobacteraceae bacterium RKSG542]|uniref:nitroreductase family protein n=1 Tax=Pseudovibrio flavus TaxID=2529854 RepID=UPI0012BCEBD1|nr:nitroreductase [Pseudovibrio flavus]MTI17146.1 nitroreductase [Pseudovibrio flavus]
MAQSLQTLLDFLESRYSASLKKMSEPAPSREQIMQMIAAAATAPDHGRLKPFRFIYIAKDKRADLADLFEEALIDRYPDASAEDVERAREKAHRGPELLVLVASIKDELETGIPADEQITAAGAALQNFLLAATAMGFASRVTSGQSARSALMHRGLSLAANERFLCFISLGTDSRGPKPRQFDASALLSDW